MDRRSFLAGAAAIAATRSARGAKPTSVPRVAFLSIRNPVDGAQYRKLFLETLAERGFPPHAVEVRFFDADWNIDVLAANARQVAAWAPDAVFAPGFDQASAMLAASRTLPIVFCGVPDPVESGLVRDLAHPGGNLTGAGYEEAALSVKRLELARDLLPRASRVCLLLRDEPASRYVQAVRERVRLAAGRLALRLEEADVAVAERGLDATLAALGRHPPDALLPFKSFEQRGTNVTRNTLGLLNGFERRHRVPVMHNDAVAVENGALISLGPGSGDQLRTGVQLLARVLQGARPAGIPVDMAVKYEIAVNLSTARALGIAIPQTVMVRAGRVVA